MAERRTVVVAARVTWAEHAAWKEKAAAAGVSPSALLRQAMARTQTWTAPAVAVERERSRQIACIGNNLNQLACWANTHGARCYQQGGGGLGTTCQSAGHMVGYEAHPVVAAAFHGAGEQPSSSHVTAVMSPQ